MAREGWWRRWLFGVATFLVLFLAWYGLTTATHTIGPGRFPAPREVWDAVRQIAVTGYADARLQVHLLHSLKVVAFGLAAAIVVVLPLCLSMGWNRAFEAFANPAF